MNKIPSKLCKISRRPKKLNAKRRNRALRQYKGRNQAVQRFVLQSNGFSSPARKVIYGGPFFADPYASKQFLIEKATSPGYTQQGVAQKTRTDFIKKIAHEGAQHNRTLETKYRANARRN